jgi:hypothetical protein
MMHDYIPVINYINKLTYVEFKNINKYYELEIEETQLEVVYRIIKNNIYALINSNYHRILYNYIKQKTSTSTCLKTEKLISEYHFYFKPVLNI